jgi:hypothetical protein
MEIKLIGHHEESETRQIVAFESLSYPLSYVTQLLRALGVLTLQYLQKARVLPQRKKVTVSHVQ